MSTARPHAPKGTYVSVIRHAHGWHDGRISGYLVDDHGTVEIDHNEDGPATPPYSQVECRHRRDYEPTEPPAPIHLSKRDRKRLAQEERRKTR